MNSLDQLSPQLTTLFKEEAFELLDQWEDACIQLRKRMDQTAWNQLFAAIHSLKGSVQTVGIKGFGEYLQTIESFLSAHKADSSLNGMLQVLLQAQTQCLTWISHIETLDEALVSAETIKLTDFLHDQPQNTHSSAVALPTEVLPLDNFFTKGSDTTFEPKSINQNSATTNVTQISDDVKMPGKLLDKILDQLSELQTHQKILESYLSLGAVEKNLAIQSLKISQTRVRELRRITSDFRSVNAEVIFKRLERSVTEALLALGKDIELTFEGHLVKLDKSIADQMVSPLIHIVRNSVDHGIEREQSRLQNGKCANGTVTVKVQRKVRSIEFTVEDDGAGIDVEKLYDKAIENRILNSIPEETSNDLVLKLLCSAGLSTASEVTEISGRGVGMNAVYDKVLSLGGSMTLEFVKGAGTRFIINVPNNFNAIKAIVVKVNDFKLAIPMNEVIEVYRFKYTDLTLSLGEQKIAYKNDIINYVNLGAYLYSEQITLHAKDILIGLVSGKGSSLHVFGVDTIIGQQEIVIRPLEERLTGLPGCQGAAYFNDGSPGLVLSLNRMRKQPEYSEVLG